MHKQKKENGLYLLVLQSRGNGVSFVVCSFVRVFPFASDPCLILKKKEREIKKVHQTVTRHWKSWRENKEVLLKIKPPKKRRYNSLFDNHVVILSLHTDPHTPHLTSCNPCSESALPHCLETELTTRAETAFCTACHLHTTLLRQ